MRILIAAASKEERHAILDALLALDRVIVQGAVPDTQSVVRALAEFRPDLVVATIELGDGNALHLIEAVRAIDPVMPIVVIGHEPSRESWRAHLEAGADRFVDRDEGFLELQDVVASFVRRERPTVPLTPAALRREIMEAMEHATACLEQLMRQRT
jgi:DNA-binding NarL/FixJ family response regulator